MALPSFQRSGNERYGTSGSLDDEVGSYAFRHLISTRNLQMILGALWLLDGLLQLFPSMWTTYLFDRVMQPVAQGQPGIVTATLQPILHFSSHHIILVNTVIAVTQIVLGGCLLSGRFTRAALIASFAWTLMVWYGGEGLGMLLTGQASALTGAPGAVLLYGFLGLAAYPRRSDDSPILSRERLTWVFAGFWGLAAVLQLQPTWWQPGQIAQSIAGNEQPGTLGGVLLDPSLGWLSRATNNHEVLVNVLFIVIATSLSIALLVLPGVQRRPLLVASIVVSLLFWWAMEGCGQLLTGSATDCNSGPLLVVLALACWPARLPRPAADRVKRLPDRASVQAPMPQ